jgi:uncharacterized protein
MTRRGPDQRPSIYARLLGATLTGALILLAIDGGVDAGPFEDGEAAYKSGDYATAVRLLGPLAEQGDATAQYNLGVIYAFGRGVPQNFPLAATWYSKSADQGLPDAQYNLGFMYEKGLGVPQDYTEAAKLYRLAADQGTAVAQSNLGLMYQSGRGVPRSYPEAVMWFRRAADQGDAEVQSNLGVMYSEGQGLPQNYVQAFMWLDMAAARDSGIRIKNNRDIVSERMTAAQIAEAHKLASEWKPKPER